MTRREKEPVIGRGYRWSRAWSSMSEAERARMRDFVEEPKALSHREAERLIRRMLREASRGEVVTSGYMKVG